MTPNTKRDALLVRWTGMPEKGKGRSGSRHCCRPAFRIRLSGGRPTGHCSAARSFCGEDFRSSGKRPEGVLMPFSDGMRLTHEDEV
jgi:hypothetical protein